MKIYRKSQKNDDFNLSNDELRDELFAQMANAQRYGYAEELGARAGLHEPLTTGLYGYVLEHIGDLTHRLGEHFSDYHGSFAIPKVSKTLKTLKWNFKEEIINQIQNNAGLENVDKIKAIEKVKQYGQKYANAHRQIPVFNAIQQAAKNAAIAVGEWRFNDAVKELETIQKSIDAGTFEQEAGEIDEQMDRKQQSDHELEEKTFPKSNDNEIQKNKEDNIFEWRDELNDIISQSKPLANKFSQNRTCVSNNLSYFPTPNNIVDEDLKKSEELIPESSSNKFNLKKFSQNEEWYDDDVAYDSNTSSGMSGKGNDNWFSSQDVVGHTSDESLLMEEAREYDTAEAFVDNIVNVFHGTLDEGFKYNAAEPIFLTNTFDEANLYAGYSHNQEPTGKVEGFYAKDGKVLDLNEQDVVQEIYQKIYGSEKLERLYKQIPERYEYVDFNGEKAVAFPSNKPLDFEVWLNLEYQENPETQDGLKIQTGSYSFRRDSTKDDIKNIKDAYKTYGYTSRQDVYNDWQDIIDYAKRQGYDYISHTTESPDASIVFPEIVALNPASTLIGTRQLGKIWNKSQEERLAQISENRDRKSKNKSFEKMEELIPESSSNKFNLKKFSGQQYLQ